MKKFLMASAAMTLCAGTAFADGHAKEVKLGVMLGFTGPIESLTPMMAAGAELAMAEATASGKLLDGAKVTPVRADSTCVDSGAATAAAEKLIADGINGLMGADCSGVTGAVLANVAIPNGLVMVSPSASSPGLSDVEDNGLFFRTTPSDARQGQVMAAVMKERGIESIALTYTNNDYGKGLADSIKANFEAVGGEVTIVAAHEDGKGDYSAEVAALASAGGDVLVVAGYLDQGGLGIIQGALDTGAFDTFGLPDGMIGDSLPENVGPDLDGSFGQIAGSQNKGADVFYAAATEAGFDGTSSYAAESYDAAALLMLAMQAAGSVDPAEYASKVMDVANAPGEEISAGELAKGLEILAAGGDINYQGATGVELVGPGESAGSFREVEVQSGKIETVKYR
ncbi:Leucine-, isoleucine-, valine-, threonine-, and alanine-binding protein precursor [Tritonibacter multivorans]|uniref:Leucine-, isoleucine-, valine-, threonine-, and alanine-binding protein n=1 Tax=Tritonibacter multivorans TaxID=928856 RepID=A0A0P1GJN3_9RHOB|nr:ABC transporter substrate-binding protein [Tritonibacter multivorans]MDA7421465.1 ABC transporter substrate-binding protein [Tritonibacter multivorans]CUH82349.1 Leucine-, isoleucine-, valine-, threonine-, and alanine-binding protein precursor [Tritonibacter multivorans]SFC99014.1 amino acid/amide ABC transporter substrate-binding protein, HAAT family (TC 3.A.1.4.-) [Tritonibacter multivorans]